jgi:hypothetical protein
MKTWIEVGQMLVLGTGTVAAKDAPMVPDMRTWTLAPARATSKGSSKHGQKRRGRTPIPRDTSMSRSEFRSTAT